EANGDDLDAQQVDDADAYRRRRLPDGDAEGHADGAVDDEDEPDRAESLRDRFKGRPRDGVAVGGRDHGAVAGADREEDRGQDPHPRAEDDEAADPGGQAAGSLGEDGLEGAP